MSDVFSRTGPLLEIDSYPAWAQQLVEDCHDAKARVVAHPLYELMGNGRLSLRTMKMFLIGGWPVIEQFPLYMAQNLTKTRFARTPGEQMARRWLMRNIRVELNHGDYWLNWAQAYDISLDELQAQRVPVELNGLSHWCWRTCAADALPLAMAATNYAIEGVTGEWSAKVCASGLYAATFPEEQRKKAMKWLKMHAHYDDAHPWEALEIICTLAGNNPDHQLRSDLRAAIRTSYDYMFLFLERCMQLENSPVKRVQLELA